MDLDAFSVGQGHVKFAFSYFRLKVFVWVGKLKLVRGGKVYFSNYHVHYRSQVFIFFS